MDKNYPFIAFKYENFDEGLAFYGKSLAFKMQPDADIINTLYPMIVDGTYLNIFSPLIVAGEEEIGAEYDGHDCELCRRGSGIDDDKDDVVEVGEDAVMNLKKREVDLVTELHIRQDVDPHADLVGEMLGHLMILHGEKSVSKTKDLLLCKQPFGLFAFLAVNEVHVSVNFDDTKVLYANANISFTRFYGGSLKLVSYWKEGFYDKLSGGDLPKCFDQFVKDLPWHAVTKPSASNKGKSIALHSPLLKDMHTSSTWAMVLSFVAP
jgi:hypothetical protein